MTGSSFLRDWDRTLRAANRPETTRYNYLLAVAQLARYLCSEESEYAGSGAALDPTAVKKRHVEVFQAWMIETRSASTALNKHKSLQQFFKWLVEEEDLERSPLDRVRQPKTEQRLIPILGDDDTAKILATCKGKDFLSLRDAAIIRVFYNTGARLSEVAGLELDDADLNNDSLLFHGKGMKDRRVRFGPRTGRALSKYLRLRARRRAAGLPALWLPEKGETPLASNGIKIMLRRRGEAAGVANVHAHRWRHNFAHEWKLAERRHRRLDDGARLGVRRHAPQVRGERGGGAGAADACAAAYRRTSLSSRRR
nr:hypothetical protein GCM10020092_031480 [Actinoplanes digitatis]